MFTLYIIVCPTTACAMKHTEFNYSTVMETNSRAHNHLLRVPCK